MSVLKITEDDKLNELYSIASEVEISLVETTDEDVTTVTAYLDYPDKIVVLAVSANSSRYEAVLEALTKGVECLEEYEQGERK